MIDQGESKSAYQVTAKIAYTTDHAYFYVVDGVSVPAAGLKASGDVFEKQTYPLLRKFIGTEPSPGIDNDVHITILNARIPGDVDLNGDGVAGDTLPGLKINDLGRGTGREELARLVSNYNTTIAKPSNGLIRPLATMGG